MYKKACLFIYFYRVNHMKKKALNRIFFTTVIFFIVFTLYSLKDINIKTEIKERKSEKEDYVYTLNDDGFISKTSVYVSKTLTLEERIKEKLEIMVEENNKNALLPSYFNPILPENTKIEGVKIEDSLVKVYFSKELMNITEKQSEKMIEAITYTIIDENILGIEIYVDNEMLKYVPHTKKEIPTMLTKDFGINKDYNLSSTNNIIKLVMTYYGSDNGKYYEIPVTKYVNDEREKIEIIFDELTSLCAEVNLITLIDDVNIIDYEITEDSVKINLERKLSYNEESILFSSIFNNYDVKKIEFFVKNEKKSQKYKKDIEK